MRTKDACTRQVISAPRRLTIRSAAQLMQAKLVGALVIVDEVDETVTPIGILTDSDIVKAVVASRADPDTLTVAEIMTAAPITCFEGDDLKEAITIMYLHGIRRLPVVDATGNLTGLIAADDVHGALLAELQALALAFTPD